MVLIISTSNIYTELKLDYLFSKSDGAREHLTVYLKSNDFLGHESTELKSGNTLNRLKS